MANAENDSILPLNDLGKYERYLTVGADVAFKSHQS